jgi:Holliday junction resolvase RusA-like endonuclease
MTPITIHIPGKVQPKQRARSTKQGHHYTPQPTRTYEGIARSLAMDAMGNRPPSRQAIRMDLLICLDIPDSWPQWKAKEALDGRMAATTKPDADNVLKSCKDALNGVVWVDDCQVVQCNVQKIYSSNPGALITVYFLNAIPAQTKTRPAKDQAA